MHLADRLYLFLLVSRSDKRNKEDKEIKCACLCYFSSDRCLYKADRSLKKYDIERQLKFSFRIKMSVPNSPFFVGNVSFILLSYDIRTESDAQPSLDLCFLLFPMLSVVRINVHSSKIKRTELCLQVHKYIFCLLKYYYHSISFFIYRIIFECYLYLPR